MTQRFARAFALTCITVLVSAALARAEGVVILDAPHLGGFPDVEAALQVASEGDTLLLGPGSHPGFVIDGLGVTILGGVPGAVTVDGQVEVRNLGAQQTVLMADLTLNGAPYGKALELQDNAGHLRFQNCSIVGADGPDACFGSQLASGAPGAVITSSARVSFASCTIRGGSGRDNFGFNPGCEGGDGAGGVVTSGSAVAFYDCSIYGGDGGRGEAEGGDAGIACDVLDYGIFGSGTLFRGGGGGLSWITGSIGGNGGGGLAVGAYAQAQLLDNTYLGGQGGSGHCCPGVAGCPESGAGIFKYHTGPARVLAAPGVLLSEGQRAPVQLTGLPGDRLFLAQSNAPAWQVPSPKAGIWLVPQPQYFAWPPKLVLPGGGSAAFPLRAPGVKTQRPYKTTYYQGYVQGAAGNSILAGPLHVVSLNRQAQPDCNGNGLIDYLDVIEGGMADCNNNLLPDACDLINPYPGDCNANLVPDDCDIASGTSADLNANGVPDECETGVTWHVDVAAAAGGNGSAASPFQTLSEGIGAASSLDTVLVADGVYFGVNNRDIDFGGRNIVVKSANGPASCVLDLRDKDPAFNVVNGETEATRIEGFTFFDGVGAIVVANLASPQIENCIFESCDAIRGGGIWIQDCSGARVADCTFRNNTASEGGAVYLDEGGTIENCLFEGNSANRGGAVALSPRGHCEVVVTHSVFLGNSASADGGGLHLIKYSGPEPLETGVFDCLFVGNQAGATGGGLYVSGIGLVLDGLTIVDNSAASGGGLRGGLGSSGLPLSDSVLWGNSATTGAQITVYGELGVEYCDVEGGAAGVSVAGGWTLNWGAGNLDLDPLFVDPDGPDNDPLTFDDNDYRLGAGSPCVDAGNNTAVPPDWADVDGDGDTGEPIPLDLDYLPRFVDDPAVPDTGLGTAPIVDMGAYERP
jgi:hypothetical protein